MMKKNFNLVGSKVHDMTEISKHINSSGSHLKDLSKILGEFVVQERYTTSKNHLEIMTSVSKNLEVFLNNLLIQVGLLLAPADQLLGKQVLEVSQLHAKGMNSPINWSESLKGDRIYILGLRVERRGDNNWTGGMALSKEPLSEISKTSWNFKISNHSFYSIYLGIALKGVVHKNNYNFDGRGALGHGCYMVDTYGNSFSHTEKDTNNVNVMRDFNKNQVVLRVTFDPIKNKVYFKVETKAADSSCELNVVPPVAGDHYHIAVFLNGINNSVEIMPEEVSS